MESLTKNSTDDNIILPMDELVREIHELEEQMKQTTHHNFVAVLKEIACSPLPDISPQIIRIFNDLQKNTYDRKEFINRLIESGIASYYNREDLNDIIQELEGSHGYSEKAITHLINFIMKHHSYSKSKITKMLETLNVPDQYTILHYGVLFNNVSFCRCLINNFDCITPCYFLQDVNLASLDGETPLHIASRLSNIKHPDRPSSMLEYLLNQPKIDINIQDNLGRTPLHFAVIYKCIGNTKYLIEHGANLHIRDVRGAIPLHYACQFLENDNMIDLFVKCPQLFNYETHDKKKPLDITIDYNSPEVIKQFFDRRYIRDLDDSTNVVTIKESTTHKHENNFLSSLKAQYEEAVDYDHSLLVFACRQLHGYRKISHLINPNSLMYRDSQTGLSPLMVAIQYRQIQCVKELLSNEYFTQEAFELFNNVSFRTVLHICAKVHHKEITKALFDSSFISKTLVLAADILGDTSLHICAQIGNVYMAKLLLCYIADPNLPVANAPYSYKQGSSEGSIIDSTQATLYCSLANNPVHIMLTKKNKKRLIPLHVAIQAGSFDVVYEILKYADFSVVNAYDDQQRTCLHMAAAKGHIGIIDILLKHQADPHVSDINEWTPLHHAVRCSRNEDDKERLQCIESLVIHGMINVNALTVRRQTPLHIACEYGSSKLVQQLIKFDCDLLAINVDSYNCLEVAIEENNEDVVKYLIENDRCFDLMRNSQIRKRKRGWCSFLSHQCEIDTPMRKLIRKMPTMASLVLDKCSMRMDARGTIAHKNIFVYEFLEDQFTVSMWNRNSSNNVQHSKLYTSNTVDLVVNHPLFLMAQCEAYDLMSHPLSNSLVKLKFKNFGIFLYILILLLYTIYLGLFTTIILRTHHPATYYNSTNFDFQDFLCYNVSQVLLTASPGLGGIKTKVDYILKYAMYTVIFALLFKNVFNIIEISQIDFFKTLRYWLETAAVLLSFIFMYDRNYQKDLTLRCPYQWEYGAFSLLLSWLTLLGYIQFMPMIGLYVTMLFVIMQKFMRFSVILLILISGFAFTFYMIFQNFQPFENAGYSYIKTAMMISGELDFDDRMHNENTKAYYKMAYLIYILFVLIMTVFVTNLLIGLAVGEIPPLMKQASDNLNRLFFELVAICEVFRYRLIWIICRSGVNDAIAYRSQDLHKRTWYQRMGQFMAQKCFLSIQDDESDQDSDIDKTIN